MKGDIKSRVIAASDRARQQVDEPGPLRRVHDIPEPIELPQRLGKVIFVNGLGTPSGRNPPPRAHPSRAYAARCLGFGDRRVSDRRAAKPQLNSLRFRPVDGGLDDLMHQCDPFLRVEDVPKGIELRQRLAQMIQVDRL